jgi:D-alanyl-D-alanine carboxypeptidase
VRPRAQQELVLPALSPEQQRPPRSVQQLQAQLEPAQHPQALRPESLAHWLPEQQRSEQPKLERRQPEQPAQRRLAVRRPLPE